MTVLRCSTDPQRMALWAGGRERSRKSFSTALISLAYCALLGCSNRHEERAIVSRPLTLPAQTWTAVRGSMAAVSDVAQLCFELPPGAEAVALAPYSRTPAPPQSLWITARFHRADGAVVGAAG